MNKRPERKARSPALRLFSLVNSFFVDRIGKYGMQILYWSAFRMTDRSRGMQNHD
jgi:hypothetical protein